MEQGHSLRFREHLSFSGTCGNRHDDDLVGKRGDGGKTKMPVTKRANVTRIFLVSKKEKPQWLSYVKGVLVDKANCK